MDVAKQTIHIRRMDVSKQTIHTLYKIHVFSPRKFDQ